MPKIVAVLPARYESTRYPGKPLVLIAGKPMIQWVYEQTKKATGMTDVFVATDSDKIKNAVEAFGGKAIMTASNHQTGTDRIIEAMKQIDADIIVNVQGDEPTIDPRMIVQVFEPLVKDPSLEAATLMRKILNPEDVKNQNIVKITTNLKGDIITLSRSPIPFHMKDSAVPTFQHLGLYAFKKSFLQQFGKWDQTPIEKTESIEIMRAIEHGVRFRAVETTFKSQDVNVPEDVAKVEALMKSQNMK